MRVWEKQLNSDEVAYLMSDRHLCSENGRNAIIRIHTPHTDTLASSEKCLCCVSNCEIKIFPLSFISSSVFTFLPSSSCTSPQSEKFLTYLCILSTLDIARVLPLHSQSRVQKLNFAPDWFFSGFFFSVRVDKSRTLKSTCLRHYAKNWQIF